jgi:hypothetical protein
MSFTNETAVTSARADLANRLNIEDAEIKGVGVSDQEFPNMALGAALEGELAAQMIASGWQILLEAGGETYEYRADEYQLRLYDFEGRNYLLDVD